ncbi:MAG: ABC transporter permease [Candidatus Omnitrophica bacterium]|nr:ABC transporter permease [Candidatus Omnitrophota bacterium]
MNEIMLDEIMLTVLGLVIGIMAVVALGALELPERIAAMFENKNEKLEEIGLLAGHLEMCVNMQTNLEEKLDALLEYLNVEAKNVEKHMEIVPKKK